MFVKHAVVDSAFLKNLTSIMSLQDELRAVLFGEETEVVIDYLKIMVSQSQSKRRTNDATTRCSVKASLSDKFVWRCKRKGCKTNVSVRDGSFFTKSEIALE